jgi:hypothetical protein
MPWFGRQKKDQPAARPPADPDLTPLDVEQAARLRALAHADLTGRGLETLVHPGHLTVDGHSFGLSNLAANIATWDDAAAWPDVVRRHFDLMLETEDDAQYGLTDDELEAAVYVRLTPEGREMHAMFSSYGNRIPGLMAVPCVDLPEKVAFASESFYEERGGFDRWWTIGLDNLQELLWEEPLEHFPVGLDGDLPQFHVVRGDSVMVASFAQFLTQLLARLGEVDLGRGVLVALPERKQVLYRIIRGPEALPAVGEMATVAASVHASTAGSLSPHVFLVDDDGWHQLTVIEGTTIKVMIGDEAAAAFGIDTPT